MNYLLVKNSKHTYLIAIGAGLLFPLGLAPFNLPGLMILSIGVWFYLLNTNQVKSSAYLSLWYGLGKYGLGISWIYVSINNFSELAGPVSLCLTVAFIIFLSLYELIVGLLFSLLKKDLRSILKVLLFSSIAVLTELLRSTMFTGLPWLLAGHSQVQTPLQNLAPLIGGIGLSFICFLLGAFLANALFIIHKKIQYNYAYALALILPFIFIPLINPTITIIRTGKPLNVSLLQGNISHLNKWDEMQLSKTLETYQTLTKRSFHDDLIVWPETALPIPSIYALDIFEALEKNAKAHNSEIILGAPGTNKDNSFSNSAFLLGKNIGRYDKQHLVPFGEYMPIPALHNLYHWFNVPFANLSQGEHSNDLFKVLNLNIAPFICFEVAFTSAENLKRMANSQLLLTITDDSWFGNSFAKAQHLQIAQMRSLESSRQQLFASNDGLTAIINNKGKIIKQLPKGKTTYLHGTVQGYSGSTFYISYGDKLIFYPCFLILAFIFLLKLLYARIT